MRAPSLAAPFACALALGAAARAGAQPHATGAPDRYGYAPAEAQVPMARLRGREGAAQAASPSAAPALRLLSWPGKATPALRAGADGPPVGSAPASAPALRPVRAAAAPRPAPVRVASAPSPAWTPRRPALPRASAPPPVSYAPAPRPVYASVPSASPAGYATAAMAASAPTAPAAAPAGVGALPPPVRPWYQRWPEAASAAPASASGVGPSLAPAPPASPPPAASAPLAALSAPSARAATPVRTAALAPSGGTARYYSLHKPYGHGPDPAPIPPQFFGPTADLSAPETPEPARATLTANASSAKAAVNAARLQQGAAD